jgi:hypothetical protein
MPSKTRRKYELVGMTRIVAILLFAAISIGMIGLLLSSGMISFPSSENEGDNWGLYGGASNSTEAVILKVEELSLNDTKIFGTIRKASCTTFARTDDRVLVGGCEDGVYFIIDIFGETYVTTYCASANTQTERFLKLTPYLERQCTDPSSGDVFLKDLGDLKVYSACGWRLVVRSECILGIGVL